MIKNNNNNIILFSTQLPMYGPNLMPAGCCAYSWFNDNQYESIRWNINSGYMDNNGGFIQVVKSWKQMDFYFLYMMGLPVLKPNTKYHYKITSIRRYTYPYSIKFAIVTGTDQQLYDNDNVFVNASTVSFSLPDMVPVTVYTLEGNITTDGNITSNSKFVIDFSAYRGYSNFRIDMLEFELREVIG